MEIRQVTDSFAVAPQILPEEVAEIAAQGFTTLVCNRPDGEESGQPGVEEIASAAKAHGLAFCHIPVSGGAFPDEAVAAFRAMRQAADGRVLAYCRTGTRSITLDTLANPDGLSVEARIERAANVGYDLTPMREQLA